MSPIDTTMKYKVNIIEHGEAQIEIEAESEDEAEEKAREMYDNGEVDMSAIGYGDNGYVDFTVDRASSTPIYIKEPFTKELCPKYNEPILPDEQGNCSLCGETANH
jgi:hypothetical protein